MSDLQTRTSPQRKEQVGTADLGFVAFVIIITAIAIMTEPLPPRLLELIKKLDEELELSAEPPSIIPT